MNVTFSYYIFDTFPEHIKKQEGCLIQSCSKKLHKLHKFKFSFLVRRKVEIDLIFNQGPQGFILTKIHTCINKSSDFIIRFGFITIKI